MILVTILLLISSSLHDIKKNSFELYSVGSRNLLSRLDNISFGYERMHDVKNSTALSASTLKPLCTTEHDPNLFELPCVKDNNCPYVRFRCSKGHRWNAMPGAMNCLQCPTCNTKTKKINGITDQDSKISINERLYPLVKNYCISQGGELLSTKENVKGWASDMLVKCSKGHTFKTKINNLILGKNWCSKCREVDYEQTAAIFGGQYLGLVETNTDLPKRRRPAMWKCAEGHEFAEYVNNIRRSPQSKRKCSWCKICKKNGNIFVWDCDKYKSTIIKNSNDDFTMI